MRFKMVLTLLFFSHTVMSNSPVNKADFAYGMDVTLAEHQLYEFSVNDAIYPHLQHADLRDLRIFDEAGVMLPIKIIASAPVDPKEVAHVQNKSPLVFFPVTESLQQPLHNISAYVQRDNTGSIIKINTALPVNQQQENIYYIVDRGEKANVEIHALEITWDSEKTPKGVVTVQTSHDLTQWQSAGTGAVFQLHHNQQMLLHNEVPVSGSKRYLKIQLDQAELLGLKSVVNKAVTQYSVPEMVQADFVKQMETRFYYRIPANYPVHALRIFPQQENALYTIQLLSGEAENLCNQMQYRGNIYKLSIGDQFFNAAAISLANRRSSFWCIDIVESNQPTIVPPMMQFDYYPHRIRFLSNQAGRYTIAFGSSVVDDLGPVLPPAVDANDAEVQTLRLATAFDLGGKEKLLPLPPPRNYSKFILWSVLAVVLALMGFMVLRLLRQMREIH